MLKIDEFGNRYWKNEKDELHRVEGPAIEWSDGDKYWYINGTRYDENEYKKKVGEVC